MAAPVEDESPRKGSIEDGSFMTALQSSPSAAADAYFEDIGYNKLVQDLTDSGVEDEAFAQLRAKRGCACERARAFAQ